MDPLDRDSFLESLRDALNHLYEAEQLRHNPLAGTFEVANRLDTSSQLRSILIQAVEALKPKSEDASNERAWRMYDSLFYCYVQRLSQQAVADQLGLSARHLRREQKAALELLADYLCAEYDLQNRSCQDDELTGNPEIAYQDLDWLRTAAQQSVDLQSELTAVLGLVAPLAQASGVRVEVMQAPRLPLLALHTQAFEQILANLLSLLIPNVLDSQVLINLRMEGSAVQLEISGKVPSDQLEYSQVMAELAIVFRLVEISQGSLQVERSGEGFLARLMLPVVDQIAIMAIDDNPDTLYLLERYTAGTRYRMVSVSNPEAAQALAEKTKPRVILLDVMMPGIDGWKLLGRLRQHPLTSHIPVIICTIFPQEKLALSLGASGFLKKPVSRQEVLDLLDRYVGL